LNHPSSIHQRCSKEVNSFRDSPYHNGTKVPFGKFPLPRTLNWEKLCFLGFRLVWAPTDSGEYLGETMSFDIQDQETVNKLPRLSELHTAYGVQVNAINVHELFDLYESTGFLYPEKAVRLLPHLDRVKENWDRMLRAGESLLYVLTAGDKQKGRASLAVWRTTNRGWTYQHLVSENNPYASRAVMLAAKAASILKGSDESSQNWFRPENRFPARVFGSMMNSIGANLSSAHNYALFALPRALPFPSDPGIRVVPYDSNRKADLCSLAAETKGHVYVTAEELEGVVQMETLELLYRRVGLRRTRHIWLAYRKGKSEPIGAVIAYRGPLGLNFSFLENRCDLLLSPALREQEAQSTASALLASAVTVYDNFELDEIPVVAGDSAIPGLLNLGAHFIRQYCQCIWLRDGYPRAYRHVDSFYSKVLVRAERRGSNSLFAFENS